LLQQRFVLNLFAAAKKAGIHRARYNGYLGDRLSDDDLGLIDLVLLDIKALSPDLHQRLTGQPNQPVLGIRPPVGRPEIPVWIRFVLVPGWTDDPAEVDRVAGFVAELDNVERVDVVAVPPTWTFQVGKAGNELRPGRHPPAYAALFTEKVIARFQAKGLKAY